MSTIFGFYGHTWHDVANLAFSETRQFEQFQCDGGALCFSYGKPISGERENAYFCELMKREIISELY